VAVAGNESAVQGYYAVAPDGTRIYYDVRGSGERTILIADGFGCDGFNWPYFFEHFQSTFKIVLVRYRGHGKSEKPYDMHNLTMEHLADDIAAVLNHAELHRPILMAYSMGVQIALEFVNRNKDAVEALIFVNGNYQYPIDTFHDTPTLKNAFPLLYHASTRYSALVAPMMRFGTSLGLVRRLARHLECNPNLCRQKDIDIYFEHIGNMDPDLAVRMMNYASSHSAEPYLPQVKLPALIVAGEKDAFTPMWVSRLMHERMPTSELFVVKGGTHVSYLEQPLAISLRIEKFLRSKGLMEGRLPIVK